MLIDAALSNEYNALLYHTRGADGEWLRARTPKNVNQHAVTLAQFWDDRDEWKRYLTWFATLPLWVDLGGCARSMRTGTTAW